MSLLSECLWRKSVKPSSMAPWETGKSLIFRGKLLSAQPSHWFQGKQSSLGSPLMLSSLPQGVSRCLWQAGSRVCVVKLPWCPAQWCLLCTIPCGGIHGVFNLSGVRTALLTSTESTLQWREAPLPWTQSPSKTFSRPLENAEKLPFRNGHSTWSLPLPPGVEVLGGGK